MRGSLIASIVLALSVTALSAEHTKPSDSDSLVPLMDNLGDHEHRVSTTKPLAQQYFNQGLRLIYGFNHDEAIRAFRAAAKLDPDCVMAHWGIALALGPNYNLEAEKERSAAAYEAIKLAQRLAARAPAAEAAYVEALSQRYSGDPQADRKQLDAAYADAMGKLAAKYPQDLDAVVLAAEAMMDLHPWELWTSDGKPAAGTEEIVAMLERVLEKNPNHPGANHFYIHAVEASPQPQRALPSALRLSGMGPSTGLSFERPLMPGAGHMVHMPAHIYFRLGWYGAAAAANQRAIDVDRQYIERFKPEGIYPMMYYPHNIHFLWAALMMEGRSSEAIAAADQVVAALDDDMVKEMPMLEYFLPTRLHTLVRFHKWNEILKEKPPLAEFTLATGMLHYAQGLAEAAGGNTAAAREHQRKLAEIMNATPEDKLLMRQSTRRLLRIADDELDARLDAAAGDGAAAVKKLEDAIAQQELLQYTEPPPWYLPMRQPLGALLVQLKRPVEAEVVIRDDLNRYPENGWSLDLLARALGAQKRDEEAQAVRMRQKKAWARADFELAP